MKFIVDLDFLDRCVLDRSIGTWNLESAAWLTPGLHLVKSNVKHKNLPSDRVCDGLADHLPTNRQLFLI